MKSEHEPLKEEASRRSTLNLDYCGDDQGNVETMKIDILTGRHKQAWLEMKTGSFRKHQTEISQRIAEFIREEGLQGYEGGGGQEDVEHGQGEDRVKGTERFRAKEEERGQEFS